MQQHPGAPGVAPAAASYYSMHPGVAGPPLAGTAAPVSAAHYQPAGSYQQQLGAAAGAPSMLAGAPGAYAAAAPAVGAKRPYDDAGTAGDGYGAAADFAKRQHTGAPGAAATAVPRETVYRLVMDIVDTALIIGRGGNTVRQIETSTGGRVKRLQEPPGAREQVVVVWASSRDLPSPGRNTRNTAQEALLECVRRVVFQESAPMGQPMTVRFLVNRTQEQGVVDNMSAIVADNPGTSIAFKRHLSLPACALDNDVVVELSGERYGLMAAVETLSHVLREHPTLERPGGASPALRTLAGGHAAAGAPQAAAPPAYGAAAPYGAALRVA